MDSTSLDVCLVVVGSDVVGGAADDDDVVDASEIELDPFGPAKVPATGYRVELVGLSSVIVCMLSPKVIAVA